MKKIKIKKKKKKKNKKRKTLKIHNKVIFFLLFILK